MATVKSYPGINPNHIEYGIWQLNECFKCVKLDYHGKSLKETRDTHSIKFDKYIKITKTDISKTLGIAVPYHPESGYIGDDQVIHFWYNSGFPIIGFAMYPWSDPLSNRVSPFAITLLLENKIYFRNTAVNCKTTFKVDGSHNADGYKSYPNIAHQVPNMDVNNLSPGYEFIYLREPCIMVTLDEWYNECFKWGNIRNNVKIADDRKSDSAFVESNFEDGNFRWQFYDIFNQIYPHARFSMDPADHQWMTPYIGS